MCIPGPSRPEETKPGPLPLGIPPLGPVAPDRGVPRGNHFDREVIPVPGLAVTGGSFPSFLPEADNSIEV